VERRKCSARGADEAVEATQNTDEAAEAAREAVEKASAIAQVAEGERQQLVKVGKAAAHWQGAPQAKEEAQAARGEGGGNNTTENKGGQVVGG